MMSRIRWAEKVGTQVDSTNNANNTQQQHAFAETKWREGHGTWSWVSSRRRRRARPAASSAWASREYWSRVSLKHSTRVTPSACVLTYTMRASVSLPPDVPVDWSMTTQCGELIVDQPPSRAGARYATARELQPASRRTIADCNSRSA